MDTRTKIVDLVVGSSKGERELTERPHLRSFACTIGLDDLEAQLIIFANPFEQLILF